MEIKPEELEQQICRFKEGLKISGVKLNHQRLEIYRAVTKSSEHPDAETIYKVLRLPSVSLDTVYRTLWLLLDLGLIDTLGAPKHQVRFDSNNRPHHHFACRKCGLAWDFHCEEFDWIKVPGLVRGFGRVEKTQVEVRGVCYRCSKEISTKDGAKRRK
jgi:Fur family transcriptional regulator, peroxide stress response regulator